MPEALAMVNVGNRECGFLKLTPLSRTSAIDGAVSCVTFHARSPSGTNRIRLCGVLFCADAAPADSSVRPADRMTNVRRMKISREKWISGLPAGRLYLVLLYDRFVTSASWRLPRNYRPCGSLR